MKHVYLALMFISWSAHSAERVFIGHYTEGFEWSYFVECGSEQRIWVDHEPAVNELKKALKKEGVTFSYELGDSNPRVLVKIRGLLSEQGEWGHLGKYEYRLKVTEYIDHGNSLVPECRT